MQHRQKWEKIRQIAFLMVFMFSLTPNSAEAATFELGGDPVLNCVVTLRGPIEPGDTTKLREYIRENTDLLTREFGSFLVGENRLCLDSAGGSISEALRLADTMLYGLDTLDDDSGVEFHFFRTLGTAIPSGARCESACAIVFMSGGWFFHVAARTYTRLPDRVMHVDSKLGFHAPSLQISGNAFDREAVEDAFEAAVEVTEMIAQRSRTMYFSPGLFFAMMSTPPREMFYVDTVAQAGSWGIQLYGVPAIQGVTNSNVANVCENISLVSETGIRQHERYFTTFIPPRARESGYGFFGGSFGGGTFLKHSFAVPSYPRDLAALEAEFKSKELPEIHLGQDDWSACEIIYERASNTLAFVRLPAMDSGLELVYYGYREDADRDYSWLLFAPYTKFSDLALLAREHGSTVSGGESGTEILQNGPLSCAEYIEKVKQREGQCRYEVSAIYSVDGLDLRQSAWLQLLDSSLIEFDVRLEPQASNNPNFFPIEEVLYPLGGSEYIGKNAGSSYESAPEVLKVTNSAGKLNSDGNIVTAWGSCFSKHGSRSVWCVQANSEHGISEYDSTRSIFPEYE